MAQLKNLEKMLNALDKVELNSPGLTEKIVKEAGMKTLIAKVKKCGKVEYVPGKGYKVSDFDK